MMQQYQAQVVFAFGMGRRQIWNKNMLVKGDWSEIIAKRNHITIWESMRNVSGGFLT
jgi:hypothetical protein